jgi:hypothetical protein
MPQLGGGHRIFLDKRVGISASIKSRASEIGAVSKMDIKICCKGPPDCGAAQMRYETHNSPRFACARFALAITYA